MKFLYEIYIPSCLFDSADSTNGFEELSEQIAKSLLVHKLKISNEKLIKRGNEKNKEPDYIINDIGYEVTFALSNMLIKQFKGIMPLTAVNEFNEDNNLYSFLYLSKRHCSITLLPNNVIACLGHKPIQR